MQCIIPTRRPEKPSKQETIASSTANVRGATSCVCAHSSRNKRNLFPIGFPRKVDRIDLSDILAGSCGMDWYGIFSANVSPVTLSEQNGMSIDTLVYTFLKYIFLETEPISICISFMKLIRFISVSVSQNGIDLCMHQFQETSWTEQY